MKSEERATKVSVVLVSYMRPTGQTGTMYVDPTWVTAVAVVSPTKCSILLDSQWLDINMNAEDFLAAIGVTP